MIDIGINLINKQFKSDRERVIDFAIKNGVSKMILTGTNLEISEESENIASKYPNVLYSTAGIHPHRASSFNKDTISILKKMLEKPHVVSIGECGLDFNRDLSPRNIQEKCFEAHLELAVEINKPLFFHEREASERFIAITKPYVGKLPNGVVHCFTGTVAEAKVYLDMGFHIGITGSISDRRFPQLVDVAKYIPIDRLMLETDAPYMMPRNIPSGVVKQERRNEPAYLKYVAQSIADAKGMTIEQVSEGTTETSKKFFNI